MRYFQFTAVVALSILPLRAQEFPVPNPATSSPTNGSAVVLETTPEIPAPIEPPIAQPVSTEVVTPGVIQAAPIAPVTPPVISDGVVAPGGAPEGVAQNFSEFSDDDLTQVLRLLARQAKISLIVSDRIATATPPIKVSVRLENKPPLDALKIIVDSKNLILDVKEDVYYVKTKEEKDAEPQIPGSYTFSYAMAEKVLPLLAAQLVSRAPAQFDLRTNTIFYREVKSNLDNIKLFLESVDKPTQQVMIEARLIEVTANPTQSYGINWAGVVGSASSPKTVSFGGSPLPDTQGKIDWKVGPGGQVAPTDIIGVPKAGAPFLTGAVQQLSGQFAILTAPTLSLALRLLNEDSDAELIANPRIITASNQEATIKITRNQPVPQLNFNEQTASAVFGGFQDKEFGNILKVLPIINKDDFITLRVDPEISNKVGDEPFNFAGATVKSPIIDKRVLSSQVLIHSGDTLAIGGLLQDEVNKGKTKVPVMGDIPVVGYAFQQTINIRTKRNLLIFVTPTVIKQGYGTGLESQVGGLHSSGEEYADPNGWRNNAKGALRVVPTSHRLLPSDYPKPGSPLPPAKYKISVPNRER